MLVFSHATNDTYLMSCFNPLYTMWCLRSPRWPHSLRNHTGRRKVSASLLAILKGWPRIGYENHCQWRLGQGLVVTKYYLMRLGGGLKFSWYVYSAGSEGLASPSP